MPNSLVFKPLRWQSECETAINTILAASDWAYIQAPTGVGKTFEIVYHGERSSLQGVRVIIVGTTKVAGQHRKVLLENGFLPDADGITFTSPSRKLWMVDTWQGGVCAVPQG